MIQSELIGGNYIVRNAGKTRKTGQKFIGYIRPFKGASLQGWCTKIHIDREFFRVLNENAMITEKDVKKLETRFKKVFVTKRDLNKTKKDIIKAISNISVNSPTINQFNSLEKRVGKLETAVN